MAGNGIPYFPLDCQFDDKFKLVKAEFGAVTYAVIIGLYQRIYGGDNGYYCEWNEEVALMFAEEIKARIGTVLEVVKAAIRRGVFDERMYHEYGILTSNGIQRRYFKAAKRRSDLKIIEEYLLFDVRNFEPIACKKGEIVYKSSENVRNFQQTKLNKTKREKIISLEGFTENVISRFNALCPSLPRAAYTVWRRDAIATLDMSIEKYEEVFSAAEKSDYLSGRSGEWVSCGLDWLLKPGNFQKVLEGTYDRHKSLAAERRPRTSRTTQRKYTDEQLKSIGIDLLGKDGEPRQ